MRLRQRERAALALECDACESKRVDSDRRMGWNGFKRTRAWQPPRLKASSARRTSCPCSATPVPARPTCLTLCLSLLRGKVHVGRVAERPGIEAGAANVTVTHASCPTAPRCKFSRNNLFLVRNVYKFKFASHMLPQGRQEACPADHDSRALTTGTSHFLWAFPRRFPHPYDQLNWELERKSGARHLEPGADQFVKAGSNTGEKQPLVSLLLLPPLI
jgi:hypothetical protein